MVSPTFFVTFVAMTYNIQHIPDMQRFSLVLDSETAYLSYRLTPDSALDIRHTLVPPPLEGKGIASALVKAAYDYALAQGLTPMATCSYAVRWLQRHPEYQGVIGPDYKEEGTCSL